MIIVRRKDGHALNISAACSTSPNTRGLIVEMPGNEFYIIPNYDLDRFIAEAGGRWGIVVIDREWKGWPS